MKYKKGEKVRVIGYASGAMEEDYDSGSPLSGFAKVRTGVGVLGCLPHELRRIR